MDQFNEPIFQQLILDEDFIRWVKGKGSADIKKWKNWKTKFPAYTEEFDEAVKLAHDFSFSPPEVSNEEVHRLWNKLSVRINRRNVPVKVSLFYLRLVKIAAVLFVPLLAYTVWVSVDKSHLESEYDQMTTSWSDQHISVIAPIGTRTVVNLPDGSKAWLNSGSELTYPALFDKRERRIEVIGEAFFQVQKKDVPFIVQNPGPEIKVYGTSFNVNSYPDEEVVTVALVEGKISLLIDGKEQFLIPGQVSYFDKSKKSVSIKSENIDRFICWREGKFIFRDTPLSSILRQLQRQYNVEINLTQPELGNYRYMATFRNENLDQIFELLSLSAPIKYQYEKGVIRSDGTYLKGKVTIYKDKERIVQY